MNLIYTERPELRDKIYIAYCPERVLPGNVIYELVHNDRVIGGINEERQQKQLLFIRNLFRVLCIVPMLVRQRCVN